MREQIKSLETLARRLEPVREEMRAMNRQVMNYGVEFVDKISERKTYNADYKPSRQIDHCQIDEDPKELSDILDIIRDAVDSTGINPASGGHLGYIPGGGIYPSSLADYLVDISNRYAGIYYANPGAVRMENKLIRWMAEILGYPNHAVGNLASGGSIANLMAVTAARDEKGISSDQVKKAVIYLTEQTHHCIHKAIRIAGLAESHIRIIPMDEKFRMDPKQLEIRIREDIELGLLPFLVVGSLGSTDTGAVDPIDLIGKICQRYGCWFHIDAAYGGFFVLIDEMKHYFEGVNRSDSIVIDPHKTLFLPYGLGAIIVKNAKALAHSHYYRANYMQDTFDEDNQWSPADLSPELTKHFRGLRMWLPLQLFGLKPFRAAIKEKWLLCRYFYKRIREMGFEVGPEPELSVCIYRFVPEKGSADQFNHELAQRIKQDGRVFISSTTIHRAYWLRLAVVCFRTHLDTIDLCLQILEQKTKEILKDQSQYNHQP